MEKEDSPLSNAERIKQEIEDKFKARQRTLILPEDGGGQPCSQPQSKRASLHEIFAAHENKKAETMHCTPRNTIDLQEKQESEE